MSRTLFAGLLLFAVACGAEGPPFEPPAAPDAEAFRIDAGVLEDAGDSPTDAGFADDAATPLDAEPQPDSGAISDASTSDVGTADVGSTRDASALDATPPDSGPVDPGPAVLNPNWIGGPCTSNADCSYSGGRCSLTAAGFPGGACTQDCTQFCPDQSGPLNSVTFCVDDGDGDSTGECYSRCDFTLSPTGCRQGYVCAPEKRFAQPSVVRYACIPRTGFPGRAVPPFDIGAPCTSASSCGYATCIADLPGGYCSKERCDVLGCPAGSRCFQLGQEDYTVCLDHCTSAAQCRQNEGYTCDVDSTCWPAPLPPPVCNLAGAAADCSAYAAMATPDFVVVTKSLRRLAHCNGSALVNAYCVGLGSSPVLDKEREGDRRTPEGVFYIPRRLPQSQYYKAFLLSYPDHADAARGLAAGLITQSEHNAIVAAQNARTEPPQFTALGGLIEIHGSGSGSDWTWGCIAADNSTIDALWPVLDVGDTVVVLH